MEAAATVTMRPASGFTVPRPSGCKRLLRKITNSSSCGSIHSTVPVNPPCPKARLDRMSPRLDEYPVRFSHPSPRQPEDTA